MVPSIYIPSVLPRPKSFCTKLNQMIADVFFYVTFPSLAAASMASFELSLKPYILCEEDNRNIGVG